MEASIREIDMQTKVSETCVDSKMTLTEMWPSSNQSRTDLDPQDLRYFFIVKIGFQWWGMQLTSFL